MAENSFFIIVYPSGNRSKLSVVEICYALDYEESHYAKASRLRYDTYDEAAERCKQLAKQHKLQLVDVSDDFLD